MTRLAYFGQDRAWARGARRRRNGERPAIRSSCVAAAACWRSAWRSCLRPGRAEAAGPRHGAGAGACSARMRPADLVPAPRRGAAASTADGIRLLEPAGRLSRAAARPRRRTIPSRWWIILGRRLAAGARRGGRRWRSWAAIALLLATLPLVGCWLCRCALFGMLDRPAAWRRCSASSPTRSA